MNSPMPAWEWYGAYCDANGHRHTTDPDRLTCLLATAAELRKRATAT